MARRSSCERSVQSVGKSTFSGSCCSLASRARTESCHHTLGRFSPPCVARNAVAHDMGSEGVSSSSSSAASSRVGEAGGRGQSMRRRPCGGVCSTAAQTKPNNPSFPCNVSLGEDFSSSKEKPNNHLMMTMMNEEDPPVTIILHSVVALAKPSVPGGILAACLLPPG